MPVLLLCPMLGEPRPQPRPSSHQNLWKMTTFMTGYLSHLFLFFSFIFIFCAFGISYFKEEFFLYNKKQCSGSRSKSGSGSTGRYKDPDQGSGSGSFYRQAKIVRKTLIVLWLFFGLLSFKNDVNVASKINKQKNFFKIVSCWGLEGQRRK